MGSLPRLLAKKSSKGPLRKKQKKFRTMRSIVRKMIVSVFLLRILDQTKSAKEKKIRKHQYQKLPNSNLWKMNKQKVVKVIYTYQRTHILLKLSLPRLLAKNSSKGPLRKKQEKFRTMRSIVR